MAENIALSEPSRYLAPTWKEEETFGSKAVEQFFFVLFKWKRLIVALLIAFFAGAAASMILKPPVRKATAKILFKPDRMPIQISDLLSPSGRVPYSRQILESEVQLFQSREVLLPAATKLLARKGSNPTQEQIENKISTLSNRLAPAAVPDTNVIEIDYFAPTPEEAEETLAAVLDEYLVQHAVAYSGSDKLLSFYAKEHEKARSELQDAEEQFRTWREATNVVSIDDQVRRQLEIVAEREKALRENGAQYEALKSKIEVQTKQVELEPERLLLSRNVIRNPLVTKLKTDLVGAEIALKDLLQRYTEQDRRVQEKREQIATIKKELAQSEEEAEIVGGETTGLNSARQELLKTNRADRALLTSILSERDSTRKQLAEARNALENLRERKLEADRLARNVSLREQNFRLYDKNLEESRILAALDKAQLSNVALIEKAHVTAYSDLRQRVGIVVLASIVGLVFGLTIAFGLEFLNNSLRTPEDVEYYLKAPVLATIPDLRGTPKAIEG